MDFILNNVTCLDLAETLDCGQAFRWRLIDNNKWYGIAFGKELTLEMKGDKLIFYNTTENEFNNIWKNYFDFNRDYLKIEKIMQTDNKLMQMWQTSSGVRVLNQEPWEALCSFIISQNNNIKRIKGIIERLCECYGKRLENGYAFPSPFEIAKLSIEDLAPLRCGFRAKYIIDAARKVASGEIDLDKIKGLSLEDAEKELTKIYGVGLKVADCTLLFGLGFSEAFPKDVWIKRAMPLLFPNGLPKECKGIEGIIQQYIFSFARKTKLDI